MSEKRQPRTIGERSERDGRWRFRLSIWAPDGWRYELENVEKGAAKLHALLWFIGCLAGLRKSTWKRWQRMADDAEKRPIRKKP